VDYQRLLIDNLNLIDLLVLTAGRQRHFSSVEQEDFGGYVRLRLIEDDYSIFRKFRGRSALKTYLSTVILNLSYDFCIDQWGRWRPSKAAEALGPVATLLERLVHRDGHTLEEAMEIVRTNHAVALGYGELRALWAQLPVRSTALEASEADADSVPAPESLEDWLAVATRKEDIKRLDDVLMAVFAKLPAKDRVMLALRFDHDLSAPEIARVMDSSTATVHRRLERSLRDLRAALSRSGLDPREVKGLIGHSTVALSPLLRAEVENFLKRVRLLKRDG
jgi:RNA polymerase sigma factor (sigma-70 family)